MDNLATVRPPAYYRTDDIEECIRFVQTQSLQNIEMRIIDGCFNEKESQCSKIRNISLLRRGFFLGKALQIV